MNRIQIWYEHLLSRSGNDSYAHIERLLAASGIDLHRLDGRSQSGPGIVFFDAFSPLLTDALLEYAVSSGNRVLAISLSDGILNGGQQWQLMAAGAADVFSDMNFTEVATTVAARLRRWVQIDRVIQSPLVQNNLVGCSAAWTSVLRQVVEVATFTTASVLISGESGTGKELIARLIHTLDAREDKQNLVTLDSTTVVPELAGSEFFGHERGAFTNAQNARDGAFALADKGTLFLDEVGELPLPLQAELLRVVQEGTYKRVGGNHWKHTAFRLVCATNRNLTHEESQDLFRRDFYYRIAAFTCTLPPLRERAEDILPLARCFWKALRPDEPPPEFDPAVRDYLLTRKYPGNVRDLKQLVARMSVRHVGTGPLTAGDIPEDDRPAVVTETSEWRDRAFEHSIRKAMALGMGLKDIGRVAEETAERIAIEDEEGNLQRAARKLGVTDRALQMRRANRRQQGV